MKSFGLVIAWMLMSAMALAQNVATFSITARDSVTGELGVAVARASLPWALWCHGQKRMWGGGDEGPSKYERTGGEGLSCFEGSTPEKQ